MTVRPVAGELDLTREQDLGRPMMHPSEPERPSSGEGGRGGFAAPSGDPADPTELDLTVLPTIADRTPRVEPLDEAAQALLWFG